MRPWLRCAVSGVKTEFAACGVPHLASPVITKSEDLRIDLPGCTCFGCGWRWRLQRSSLDTNVVSVSEGKTDECGVALMAAARHN